MADTAFDAIVIGAGPGGYVTAIRASQLGLKTALVEREHLGGICLNWGCIPTKALLRASEIYHLLHRLDEFGISAKDVQFDTRKLVARSRKVAKRLVGGVKHLLRKNDVAVFDGHGRLAGRGRVRVEREGGPGAELSAPHVILATGARPRTLPGIEPDGRFVWTYKEAMVPAEMPRSILVIGSGAIGIEFASFYRTLGAEVTVVELLPRILPAEDEEVSAFARTAFEKQGIQIVTEAKVGSLETGGDGATASVERKAGPATRVTVDRVILSVGIVGNVEDIGLEGTAVRVEGGQIAVDEWLETGEPGVDAIGDVVGPPWLAHKASHEGVVCIEKIAGVKGVHPLDPTLIPACTYCMPQIASIGLTEAQARESRAEVKVGRFPFRANGKALALGEPDGFVKTVFDARTGELLGAHMVGSEVTELIQGYAVGRTLEATEAELIRAVFPHPTLSEMMHESVLDAFGRALHV